MDSGTAAKTQAATPWAGEESRPSMPLQDLAALTLAATCATCAQHSALYEEGPVVKGRTRGSLAGGWDSSLYRLLGWEEQVDGSSGWPSSGEGRQATRALVGALPEQRAAVG
jgi:hypothetical protein